MAMTGERIDLFLQTEITYHLAMQDSKILFDEWFKHISPRDKI